MTDYFIIFGGGGIRGISYCGAYKALKEKKINYTGLAGSSVGAVFASLLSVGYNEDEIFEIMSTNVINLFRDINIDFKKDIGFSKGNVFLELIREKIEKKFYKDDYKKGSMPPVKFKDINKKLVIFSVDLTDMKYVEFSSAKTPDFEIAKAVRASVSMPGLFTPYELDEKLYVDGDLLKAIPLWRVSDTIKNLDERIIEFRLEDNETSKRIENSIEYINRVYNAICGFATDYIIDLYQEKDKFDYIKINTPDISVVDFLLPKEKKENLIKMGYKATSEYFREFYPKKKKRLEEKYTKLFEKINTFQKEFTKNKFFNSYIALCEVFMYLCEEKKYLDCAIVKKITNFKDNYMKNYKAINFLGFKSGIMLNKNEISKEILDIIKVLTFKLEELKH